MMFKRSSNLNKDSSRFSTVQDYLEAFLITLIQNLTILQPKRKLLLALYLKNNDI